MVVCMRRSILQAPGNLKTTCLLHSSIKWRWIIRCRFTMYMEERRTITVWDVLPVPPAPMELLMLIGFLRWVVMVMRHKWILKALTLFIRSINMADYRVTIERAVRLLTFARLKEKTNPHNDGIGIHLS